MKGKKHTEEAKQRISEKMQGNNNAEVWNEEEALELANNILSYVKDNKGCSSLAEACVEFDQYEEITSYLSNKYDSVFKSIKKAKEIIKARLIDKGLNGDTNPTMTIFILKNNHDMKDKVETENNTNHTIKGINLKDSISFDDTTE